MIANLIRRWQTHVDQPRPDAGFTLIEVLIAVALSSVIAGVTVAAMLTSMNVIDVTTEQITTSTDTGLIASWFYRDAQAAGGTAPATGRPDAETGESVLHSTAGWQGCVQPGALVVRFSWTDRVASGLDRDVVVTYSLNGTKLTRRQCIDGAIADLVLGGTIADASATCSPDRSCVAAQRVSLQITGVGERIPADHTLTASLRDVAAPLPNSTTSVAAPLVVLGGDGTLCPPIALNGACATTVIGDVVVSDACGASAVGGDPSRLQPGGSITRISDVTDPLEAVAEPDTSCTAAPNPTPLGVSSAADAVIVHPQPVVINNALALQPGRYLFCNGLTLSNGAVLTGTGVTLIVQGGTLRVEAGARADLWAPTTGDLANLLIWVMSSQSLSVDAGPAAVNLRGLLYAPDADVTVHSQLATSLGGLVVRSVTFDGPGTTRLGLPIPSIGIAPIAVAAGQQGAPFAAVTFIATGGTAPYQFVVSGLPAGLTVAATGQLSGVPIVNGTFDTLVTAIDATGAGATIRMPMTIGLPAGIAGPATLPAGVAGSVYPATTMTASGGTAPMTWSATGIPAGMTLSPAGVLSGTPAAAGQSSVIVTMTDAVGASATRLYDLTIGAALAVADPAGLPAGQVGVTYFSTTMIALGGTGPYLWSATGLPPGVTMSVAGVVTGTPTSAGTFSVLAFTSDSVGTMASKAYTVTIAAAGTPVPPGCPSTPAGWRGEYYANLTLAGSPILCRDDAAIDFPWNGASPGAGVPGTNFSVRWTRTANFTAGTYEFLMGSDDGARLYIDGVLMMNDWVYRSYTSRSMTQTMTAGTHTVVMEFFQGGGLARATLTWAQVVPAVCPASVTGWLGEYFRNRTLTGPSMLCRDDSVIDFNWGQGTPGAPIPADDFSVRWTRTSAFAAGSYTFRLGSDDGSRLYIDGVLVGDWWYDVSYTTRAVTRSLTAGNHTIVMEFYERGGLARATLRW